MTEQDNNGSTALAVSKPADAPRLPHLLQQSDAPVKASERIEMHRAAAQVYASLQLAQERPRDEQQCFNKVITLCDMPEFAADALYALPRGSGKVEGINVKAAREFMRIWGNLEAGYIEHGRYAGESQMESYCLDLETNVKYVARYTVAHERKVDDQIKKVTDPREIEELYKARAAKETRNVILQAIGFFVCDEVVKRCKRTLFKAVSNLDEATNDVIAAFGKLGVTEIMLLRYMNRKQRKELKVDDIVELRGLYKSFKEDSSLLPATFPDRKKVEKETTQEPAKPADKPPAATEQAKAVSKPAGKKNNPAKEQPAPPPQVETPEPPPAEDQVPDPEQEAEPENGEPDTDFGDDLFNEDK